MRKASFVWTRFTNRPLPSSLSPAWLPLSVDPSSPSPSPCSSSPRLPSPLGSSLHSIPPDRPPRRRLLLQRRRRPGVASSAFSRGAGAARLNGHADDAPTEGGGVVSSLLSWTPLRRAEAALRGWLRPARGGSVQPLLVLGLLVVACVDLCHGRLLRNDLVRFLRFFSSRCLSRYCFFSRSNRANSLCMMLLRSRKFRVRSARTYSRRKKSSEPASPCGRLGVGTLSTRRMLPSHCCSACRCEVSGLQASRPASTPPLLASSRPCPRPPGSLSYPLAAMSWSSPRTVTTDASSKLTFALPSSTRVRSGCLQKRASVGGSSGVLASYATRTLTLQPVPTCAGDTGCIRHHCVPYPLRRVPQELGFILGVSTPPLLLWKASFCTPTSMPSILEYASVSSVSGYSRAPPISCAHPLPFGGRGMP